MPLATPHHPKFAVVRFRTSQWLGSQTSWCTILAGTFSLRDGASHLQVLQGFSFFGAGAGMFELWSQQQLSKAALRAWVDGSLGNLTSTEERTHRSCLLTSQPQWGKHQLGRHVLAMGFLSVGGATYEPQSCSLSLVERTDCTRMRSRPHIPWDIMCSSDQ